MSSQPRPWTLHVAASPLDVNDICQTENRSQANRLALHISHLAFDVEKELDSVSSNRE